MASEAYQVIARRWRPKQFNELVGQDHIKRTLKNAIETGRIAHAFLFVGPRGTGKTTTARLFAKALNAEGGPSIEPDNASDLAKSIMNGSCMDVIEIDGASNNSVDDIRDLREACQYSPAEAAYKIYIIDEVHMLSPAAFNALLKTLEEPPPHVKFIFATTESHKVLPTIVSRCQRFEFRPIPDRVIADKLREIAGAEEIEIDEGALAAIARLANGGMRDSQSILDQMISFCGKSISEADVLDVYGLVGRERVEDLARALVGADFKRVIDLVDTFAGEGRDLYRLLGDLQARFRETLVDAVEQGGASGQLGQQLSSEALMRMLDALRSGETAVQKGLSDKVNFEVTLLRAAEQSRSRAIDTVIREVSQLASSLPETEGAGSKKKVAPDSPAGEAPGGARELSRPTSGLEAGLGGDRPFDKAPVASECNPAPAEFAPVTQREGPPPADSKEVEPSASGSAFSESETHQKSAGEALGEAEQPQTSFHRDSKGRKQRPESGAGDSSSTSSPEASIEKMKGKLPEGLREYLDDLGVRWSIVRR